MSDFPLLECLGVRVYVLSGLPEAVIFVENQGLALIRDDVRGEDLEWAVNWLADEALGLAATGTEGAL